MLHIAGLLAIFSTYPPPPISNKVWGQGHVTTPGYFDVKVSDGKHALFDVKLDDLSEKLSVQGGGGVWSAGKETAKKSDCRPTCANKDYLRI